MKKLIKSMLYNPFSLEKKIILVTGASSGIGKATAIECSKLGATVIITARNETRLRNTFGALDNSFGQQHQMILADLTVEAELSKLVEMMPSLDGMSLNAGVVRTVPIKFIKEDELMEVLNINIISAFNLTQSLVKKKKINKNASIVFTSSIAGIYTVSMGNTMYSISKGALNAYMKNFALEFASKSIRSNSVNPGMIETNILTGRLSSDDLDKNKELYPLGRYGRPEEVAWAIIYLLSDASSWVTGHTLVIDGGVTLR